MAQCPGARGGREVKRVRSTKTSFAVTFAIRGSDFSSAISPKYAPATSRSLISLS